jgi:hypothetical protein
VLAIHIGPGRLGLGLIVPCLRQAGFDVCLVGRPDADREELPQYLLDWTDPRVGLELRSVSYACNAGCAADLPDAVRAYVASDEPLVITGALGPKNAPACEGLIGEILELRPAGAQTDVIVCENEDLPIYRTLAERHGDRATFCWSVVDRVCTWLDSGTRRGGRRAVRAHPVGEWVIGHPDPQSPTMQALAQAPEVRVVVPDHVPAYKHRKLWTVNGLHLVLALLARRSRVDVSNRRMDVLPLVAREAEFQEIAAQVCEGIDAGLLALHRQELSPDPAYGPARVQVFCETPDRVERVLRSLVRADLRDFMRRFDERVCDAARATHDAGGDVTVFRKILANVLLVLRDERSYYDDPDAPLDPDVDAGVVEAFAHALRDWLPEEERAARVADLRRTLEQQRALRS